MAENLNASVDFFNHLYEAGKPRIETYQEMVESTLSYVRQGLKVCLVLYGHPGVFLLARQTDKKPVMIFGTSNLWPTRSRMIIILEKSNRCIMRSLLLI